MKVAELYVAREDRLNLYLLHGQEQNCRTKTVFIPCLYDCHMAQGGARGVGKGKTQDRLKIDRPLWKVERDETSDHSRNLRHDTSFKLFSREACYVSSCYP